MTLLDAGKNQRVTINSDMKHVVIHPGWASEINTLQMVKKNPGIILGKIVP